MSISLNILLVEDNPGDAMLMWEFLLDNKRFDFMLDTAETLKSGIELVHKNNYDIVLLDLGLPDSEGLEALKIMLEKAENIPIIVITGLNDDETGRIAVEMGAQSYLIKGGLNGRIISETIAFSVERNKILSEIRKKDAALVETIKLLKEANEAKERLIAMLSHDLRGPVKSLVSLLELLHESFDTFSEDKKKQIINACIKSGTSTIELMETLLDWARSQSDLRKIDPQPHPAKQFIDNALTPLLQGANDKNLNIQNNISGKFSFYADSYMIATVVRNIVSNAIKFTSSGGDITINAEKVSDNKIKINIVDSGVGIEKKDMSKLFNIDEGFTTPGTNEEKGTGFGLILCKEFVEKNDGEIEIKSEIEKGTAVSILLPSA